MGAILRRLATAEKGVGMESFQWGRERNRGNTKKGVNLRKGDFEKTTNIFKVRGPTPDPKKEKIVHFYKKMPWGRFSGGKTPESQKGKGERVRLRLRVEAYSRNPTHGKTQEKERYVSDMRLTAPDKEKRKIRRKKGGVFFRKDEERDCSISGEERVKSEVDLERGS